MNRRKFLKTTAVAIAGIITPIAVIAKSTKPTEERIFDFLNEQDKSKPAKCQHDYEDVNLYSSEYTYISISYLICKKCDFVHHNPYRPKPICIEVDNYHSELVPGMKLSTQNLYKTYPNNNFIILHIRNNKVWLLPIHLYQR